MLLNAYDIWEAFLEGVVSEEDVEEKFCHLDKLRKAFQTENKSQRGARVEVGGSGRKQNRGIKK